MSEKQNKWGNVFQVYIFYKLLLSRTNRLYSSVFICIDWFLFINSRILIPFIVVLQGMCSLITFGCYISHLTLHIISYDIYIYIYIRKYSHTSTSILFIHIYMCVYVCIMRSHLSMYIIPPHTHRRSKPGAKSLVHSYEILWDILSLQSVLYKE